MPKSSTATSSDATSGAKVTSSGTPGASSPPLSPPPGRGGQPHPPQRAPSKQPAPAAGLPHKAAPGGTSEVQRAYLSPHRIRGGRRQLLGEIGYALTSAVALGLFVKSFQWEQRRHVE
eukprot:jgi/Mesen1/231/ME1141909C07646